MPDLEQRPVAWEVTAELLARHDRPGPRYTSYPTAVEFHEGVDGTVYERALALADRSGSEPLSVYVHLPFCDERCFFCGCNVIISPRKERAAPYLELLRREADQLAQRLRHRRRLAQLHLGGGTPTYFSPDQLVGLVSSLFAVFPVQPGAELAIEVDPRVTTDEHLDALAGVGFNRVSLGVQDFAAHVQQAVNRVQSVEQTAHLVDRARGLGFSGINVDLIYGLPRQDVESFRSTVDTVIGMGVDRAAVYSFAHVPWMHAHMNKLPSDELPSRETKFALFAVARQRFLEAGYETIGMDHFARPEDELAVARRAGRLTRNFQGYSVVPATDTLGLGISAIGDVGGAYFQNHKKLRPYRGGVEQGRLPVERGFVRTADDELRRAVIRELMCNFFVDVPAIERRFGIRFVEYFATDLDLLGRYEGEHLVRVRDDRITVTPLGELFVRNLAMCFDRYLRERHEGQDRLFSRTV
jgi:oxygen-independent coproporphyrinogen-3 oxidase